MGLGILLFPLTKRDFDELLFDFPLLGGKPVSCINSCNHCCTFGWIYNLNFTQNTIPEINLIDGAINPEIVSGGTTNTKYNWILGESW